ncbi:molybdopterin-dependent oxidoreductase [Methylibium sp.]|uniref:molybdopterin-dependent oxidoreductase n=1 Tax=Methylibium sp. TaxID=2067992 RepID=UPI00180E432E|nr:molybdopterin-dependent oxidoreductase [Methylibium sp.]MBA3592037.1 molybdopterin-dependent oxidoreductase [Methylibium sp.]
MKRTTFTLTPSRQRERRGLLRSAVAAVGAAALTGCDRLSNNESFVDVLKSAEHLSRAAQKLVAPRSAMAQEFDARHIAENFRSNGTRDPVDADYRMLRRGGFADFKLAVGGLVEQPAEYTLAQLRAMPSRTQITRHDCVEGWSCIGKWKGVPLGFVLDRAKPLPQARFVVFRCFDSMDEPTQGASESRYY